jgi:hypothetical protein
MTLNNGLGAGRGWHERGVDLYVPHLAADLAAGLERMTRLQFTPEEDRKADEDRRKLDRLRELDRLRGLAQQRAYELSRTRGRGKSC